MEKIAHRKYREILNRSFKKSFYQFLLKLIIEEKDKEKILKMFTVARYEEFRKDNDRSIWTELDRRSYQLRKISDEIAGIKILDIEKIFKDEQFKDKSNLFKNIYSQSFLKKEKFYEIYGDDMSPRYCSYCGISEDQIEKLFNKDEIKTKRWATRGRNMEVDRVQPNDEYNSELVLCCYWCNNAKTDEFSGDEFKNIIAPSIRMVWNQRLEKKDLSQIQVPAHSKNK